MSEIPLYAVVTVVDNEHTRKLGINGRRGIVVGTSDRDDGTLSAYAVQLDYGEPDEGWVIAPENVVPTGEQLTREDLYTGESIRVSATGEYLGPGQPPRPGNPSWADPAQ